MTNMKNIKTLLLCCVVGTLSAQQMPVYLDASQPIEKRIDDALSRMTLEENATAQGYTYVDITKVMYDEAGNLRTDIFKEDNLHMNAEGYKLWTAILKPLLIKKVRGE